MAQAQLDIILNAQKYQRDLVKTLGLTEKQAATQALKMAREQKKAAESAARAQEQAARRSGAAWKSALGAVSIAAVAGFAKQAVQAVAELTKEIIDYKNAITDAATRTGLTNETLQGLKLAAEGSGQEFDSWVKVVEKIPKLLADVESGSKRQQDAFRNLGVRTHNAAGDLRSADDVLRDIVENLSKIEDPTLRAARAADLFGRSGGKMVQALSGGAEQLDAYIRFADRWGVDVGPKAAEVAALNQREFAALSMVYQGMKGDVVGILTDTSELGSVTKNVAGTMITLWTALKLGIREYSSSLEQAITVSTKLIEEGPKAAGRELRKQKKEDTDTNFLDDLRSAVWAFNADWDAATKGTPLSTDPADTGGGTGGGGKPGDVFAQIASISKQATSDIVSDEQKIRDAFEETKTTLLDIMDAYKDESAEGQAAAEALILALEHRDRMLDKLREDRMAKERAEYEAAKKLAQQRADDEMKLARQVSESKISLAASSASAVGSIAQSLAGNNETAQRRAWAVDKASAIAAAGLNTALAVSNAFADVPYPANIFAAIEAGVQGAAHFASVAASPAPQFYEGGTISTPYADPRGTPLSMMVDPRERIKIEPQGNDRQDGGVFAIENYWDGKQVDTQIARRISRGGPTAAVIRRRSGKLGHSSQFRSG